MASIATSIVLRFGAAFPWRDALNATFGTSSSALLVPQLASVRELGNGHVESLGAPLGVELKEDLADQCQPWEVQLAGMPLTACNFESRQQDLIRSLDRLASKNWIAEVRGNARIYLGRNEELEEHLCFRQLRHDAWAGSCPVWEVSWTREEDQHGETYSLEVFSYATVWYRAFPGRGFNEIIGDAAADANLERWGRKIAAFVAAFKPWYEEGTLNLSLPFNYANDQEERVISAFSDVPDLYVDFIN